MEPIAQLDGLWGGPFHARQLALGASFYEDLGRLWADGFGDPVAEYRAVREGAGLWDISALAVYRFTGPEALPALDRLCTRRIVGAEPGSVRYVVMLDQDARLADEGTAYVVSADEAWYVGNDDRAPFAEHLARWTEGRDVRIEDLTTDVAALAVQGPRSYEVLAGLTSADLSDLRFYRFRPEVVEVAGVPVRVSRTGFSGDLGYELFLVAGADGAEDLWDALAGAGAAPFGLDAVELLRVEVGLPIADEDYVVFGSDPYEVGLARFIELGDERDFVGREAAVRRAAAPHGSFVTLTFEGPADPPSAEPGTALLAGGRAATVAPVPLDREAALRMRAPVR